MGDITGKIELFHNLFTVCLILAVLCLTVAVLLLFVLDIKNVIGYLTGYKAKKRIRELASDKTAAALEDGFTAVLEAEEISSGTFLLEREWIIIHTEDVI